MANPASREQLKQYALRILGKPVIEINVDDDQLEDRLDEALQYFAQYHYDGVERTYLKYKVTQADVDRQTTDVEAQTSSKTASKVTNTFTGDGTTSVFTLGTAADNAAALTVKLDGVANTAFTVSGTTLTMVSAPASGATLVVKLSNTVDFEEDTAIEGGSSEGSYITKTVNLENPSTALDIRVAASVRSSSSIAAFFRVSGGEETRRIKDIEFTPFNTDGSEDVTVTPAEDDETFKEYKYSATGLNDFTSFQLKIVMKGTISSYPPRIRDMRGIALAV